MTGTQIRVGDLIYAIIKRRKLIILTTLIGVFIGVMLVGMHQFQNVSSNNHITGSLLLTTQFDGTTFMGNSERPNQNDFHLAEDMTDVTSYIMKSDQVLGDVINSLSLVGVNTYQIRNALSIQQYQQTQVLEYTFNWYDAEEGINIMNAIISRSQKMMNETLHIGSLQEINKAAAHMVSYSAGNSGNMFALAILAGFAFGIAIAMGEIILRPTLTNVNDVNTLFQMETLEVIGHDDEYFNSEQPITSDALMQSTTGQKFSALAYIVRNRLGNKHKHHIIYVTSATSSEGKTSIATNLAVHLAAQEFKTLLIDLDTIHPRVGNILLKQVDYNHSLNALYDGECTIKEAITQMSGYLDILPALIRTNNLTLDNSILEMIDQLKEQYDYIIIDTAPVGEVSNTLSINKVAHNCLFVMRHDSTPLPFIQNSINTLTKSGVRILGCVVNDYKDIARKKPKKYKQDASPSMEEEPKKTRFKFRKEKTTKPVIERDSMEVFGTTVKEPKDHKTAEEMTEALIAIGLSGEEGETAAGDTQEETT